MKDNDMIIGTGVAIKRRDAFTRSMRDKPFTEQPSFHRGKTKVLQKNKNISQPRPKIKREHKHKEKLGCTEVCVLNSCHKD